jgi:hypothetical protein
MLPYHCRVSFCIVSLLSLVLYQRVPPAARIQRVLFSGQCMQMSGKRGAEVATSSGEAQSKEARKARLEQMSDLDDCFADVEREREMISPAELNRRAAEAVAAFSGPKPMARNSTTQQATSQKEERRQRLLKTTGDRMVAFVPATTAPVNALAAAPSALPLLAPVASKGKGSSRSGRGSGSKGGKGKSKGKAEPPPEAEYGQRGSHQALQPKWRGRRQSDKDEPSLVNVLVKMLPILVKMSLKNAQDIRELSAIVLITYTVSDVLPIWDDMKGELRWYSDTLQTQGRGHGLGPAQITAARALVDSLGSIQEMPLDLKQKLEQLSILMYDAEVAVLADKIRHCKISTTGTKGILKLQFAVLDTEWRRLIEISLQAAGAMKKQGKAMMGEMERLLSKAINRFEHHQDEAEEW